MRPVRVLPPAEAIEIWKNFLKQKLQPMRVDIIWKNLSSKANNSVQGSGQLHICSTEDGIEGQWNFNGKCKFFYKISSQNATWQEYAADGSSVTKDNPSQLLLECGNLSLFDISMPFLYWETVTYLGPDRVLGRPVQRFLLQPNTFQKQPNAIPSSIEIALDTTWGIWLKIIYKDANGNILRYVNVLQLQRLGEADFEETIDFKTFPSREKTRLTLRYNKAF
jgi:hypothetical protein